MAKKIKESIEPTKQAPKRDFLFENIQKNFPMKRLEKQDVYFVGNKMLVGTNFICAYFDISIRLLSMWQERGLQRSDLSMSTHNLFDFWEIVTWVEANIDADKATKSTNRVKGRFGTKREVAKEIDEIDLHDVDIDEAERLEKIEKVKMARLKNAELEGKMIPIDQVAIMQTEPIIVMLSELRTLRDIFPEVAKGKSKAEIEELFDSHVAKMVEDAKNIILKEVDIEDDSVLDILRAILHSEKDYGEIREFLNG